MVILLSLLCLSSDIVLPTEITAVTSMIRKDNYWLIHDGRSHLIWRLENDVATPIYDNKGTGPGAYKRLSFMRENGDHLYLGDMFGRKIIVLDQAFQFKKDIHLAGLPRELLVHDGNLYVVYWDPVTEAMIHIHRPDGERLHSFGKGLTESGSFGFQSGTIVFYQNHLYFIHHFLPKLQRYNPDGKLLASFQLPGFEDKPLAVVAKLKRGSSPYRYNLSKLMVVNNKIVITQEEFAEREAWFLVFNPNTDKFVSRSEAPWDMELDQNNQPYLVNEDESEHIILSPLEWSQIERRKNEKKK